MNDVFYINLQLPGSQKFIQIHLDSQSFLELYTNAYGGSI